jgi:hypothetical protein
MKSLLLLCKKHSIAVIFYLLHTLICARLVILSLDKHSAVHGPDGGLPYVFMAFVAIIIILVNILNAVFRREGKFFYLWITLIMITQTLIMFYIAW